MKTPTEHDPTDPVLSGIRAYLEAIKDSVCAELRGYPQPIAGCDVQFTHLSAERDRIARELERLDALRAAAAGPEQRRKAIDGFIRTSAYVDDDTVRKIRAGLSEKSPV